MPPDRRHANRLRERLGIGTKVYPGSAELAAVTPLRGRIPTVAESMAQVKSR